ncbi:enoyl-CoA hydratase [Nakamurella leprariae]|uniref:Enoyl-CoA hydratase/isomerase family protein n=1 Tax=Nakamurella leprariae TaxID=2803911 RepID=A0A938YDE4_9ACTN|nr:enoyl-CoA hydratase [Nakamurella leprariae]MBM9467548.1 enoyl-CoA hydratase/isomerase family protein [Nakamurella leprariae]
MSDDLLVEVDGPVLRVTFDRPEARNAMTFGMYQGLVRACDQADADDAIRVMVLRGAGGRAFVAGTDIAQFAGFDGPRGVAYEREIDATIGRLLAVRVPVVAAIDGACVGGGLAIAAAADLRVAHPSARFGYPIARTLGNTLSAASYALTLRHFGHARTVDMVMTARLLDAEEAHACGFVARVAPAGTDLTAVTDELVGTLLEHAPLTLWAAKEILRRVHAAATGAATAPAAVDATDVIDRVYGSADFAAGVAAFTGRGRAEWTGR